MLYVLINNCKATYFERELAELLAGCIAAETLTSVLYCCGNVSFERVGALLVLLDPLLI